MDATFILAVLVILAIRKETTRILTDWWNR